MEFRRLCLKMIDAEVESLADRGKVSLWNKGRGRSPGPAIERSATEGDGRATREEFRISNRKSGRQD